jgi:hypothetical protein
MGRSGADWLGQFADKLGSVPPSADEVETLLALAATAAHASERTAAPVACWLAARAGVDPATALGLAQELIDVGDSPERDPAAEPR